MALRSSAQAQMTDIASLTRGERSLVIDNNCKFTVQGSRSR